MAKRKPKDCPKCEGEGKVADSERGEPWSQWASLPPGSDLSVRLGVVKPVACPKCGGTGKAPSVR